MSQAKDTMNLNINRTSQLLINKENSIVNPYIFLFHNTDNKPHNFYFKSNNENINVIRPSKPFLLKAGEESRKIVALSVNRDRITKLNNLNLGVVDIEIHAYAIDDEKIFIKKKTVFFVEK
jgi:polyferredoxin